MIESVLTARDMFLKPGGTIWPSEAQLYITPCSAGELYEEKVNPWGEAYGLDFSPLRYVEKLASKKLRLDPRGERDFTMGNSHWKNLFLNSSKFVMYYY